MTDLTVLHAPNALFPTQSTSLGLGFTFTHRSGPFTATPMVTLSNVDQDQDPDQEPEPDSRPPSTPAPTHSDLPKVRTVSPRRAVDDTLLSPPTNTWTSRPPRNRNTRTSFDRPKSAPPTATRYSSRRGSIDVFEQPVLSVRTPRSHSGATELSKPPPPLCTSPYTPRTSAVFLLCCLSWCA